MTPESPLDALRRLDREATPGRVLVLDGVFERPRIVDDAGIFICEGGTVTGTVEGLQAICDAINTLPALLRLVPLLEEARTWLPGIRRDDWGLEYCTACTGRPPDHAPTCWAECGRNAIDTALAELTTPAPAEEESHE